MRLGDVTKALRSQRHRLGPFLLLELPPVGSEGPGQPGGAGFSSAPSAPGSIFWGCPRHIRSEQCQAERDTVTSPAKGSGPGPRAAMGSPAQSLVTCPECQHLVSCSPWGTPPWVVEGVRRSRPAPRAPNWVQCWDPSTRGAWVGWGEPSAEPPGWPHGATGPRSPGGSTQGGQSDFMKHIWLNELLRERRRPAQPAMPPGPCVP